MTQLKSGLMALAIVCLAMPASARAEAENSLNDTNISWLDFNGWDHNLITGAGQTFTNISGTADVTVTGSGVNNIESTFDTMGNIETGAHTGGMTFTFTFSEPRELVVDVQSIDRVEMLTITSTGSAPVYTHDIGAAPTQAGSLTLTGNGFAFGPDGSSRGLIELGTTSSFTWEYTTFADNKYEWFRVGEVVPEPGTWSLLGLGGLALFGRRRR